jgi:hypothetical protein
MRKKIKLKMEAARARTAGVFPSLQATHNPLEQLNKVRSIVDALYAGEKTWDIKTIAERHELGYWTVYRALKGRPGWLPITRRQVRVTDSLYRSWLQSWALGIPLAS